MSKRTPIVSITANVSLSEIDPFVASNRKEGNWPCGRKIDAAILHGILMSDIDALTHAVCVAIVNKKM
jgi:hypothetical protein